MGTKKILRHLSLTQYRHISKKKYKTKINSIILYGFNKQFLCLKNHFFFVFHWKALFFLNESCCLFCQESFQRNHGRWEAFKSSSSPREIPVSIRRDHEKQKSILKKFAASFCSTFLITLLFRLCDAIFPTECTCGELLLLES
jgi:hypothetical protein